SCLCSCCSLPFLLFFSLLPPPPPRLPLFPYTTLFRSPSDTFVYVLKSHRIVFDIFSVLYAPSVTVYVHLLHSNRQCFSYMFQQYHQVYLQSFLFPLLRALLHFHVRVL